MDGGVKSGGLLGLLAEPPALCAGSENRVQERRLALAGVAQWVGHWPASQKVASSIPSQRTCLGCRPGPQLGVCERRLIDVSLTHQCFSHTSMFLFLSFSLSKKIFKCFLKKEAT